MCTRVYRRSKSKDVKNSFRVERRSFVTILKIQEKRKSFDEIAPGIQILTNNSVSAFYFLLYPLVILYLIELA